MKKVKKPYPKKPPIPVATAPKEKECDQEAVEAQFQVELYWCIQQLQKTIDSGKLDKKLQDDAAKNCRTLKSSTAQLVKKRQLMKLLFGDYRAKMKDEEKKLGLASKNIKFTQPATANTSSFVKKSAILASGKNFKFNFNIDGLESDNHDHKEVAKENFTFTQSKEPFKFNFQVDESNESLNLQSLAI